MTARTLWGGGKGLERRLLDHTTADDRPWDARLLRWDVLGSLGHIEGLRAARLLSAPGSPASTKWLATGRSPLFCFAAYR